MEKYFSDLRIVRNNIKKIVDSLSLEQLNTVPDGFKNNVIWNAAHVVVTQQLLCYRLSALTPHVPETFINKYKKGSKVEGPVSLKELEEIKHWLFESLDRVVVDYKNGLFENKHFKPYQSSFGLSLEKVEDAVRFNNIHEGVHLGYMMAMLKHL